MSRRFLIAVALATLLPTTPTLALDCARTEATLGRGPSSGVAVAGDFALIGAGTSIVSFDLSEPAAPVMVGETRFGTGAPYGEEAAPLVGLGELALAWVFEGHAARLAVLDPSAGGAPAEIGSLPIEARVVGAVVVEDQAWLATLEGGGGGLFGVDLSDPERPQAGGRILFARRANAVATAGDLVLVATDAGVHVVDIANPTAPAVVGWLPLAHSLAVAAAPGRAFVATMDLAVHVIDLADPSAPAVTTTLTLPHAAGPGQMAVVGERLLLGMKDYDPSIGLPEGGLAILDISDPDDPSELGFATFSSGAAAIAPAGDLLVVADRERGLRILRITAAGEPTEIAHRNPTLDDALAVAVRGDLALIGDQGLRIVNIADHVRPLELAAIELEGEILAVSASPDSDLVLALSSTDQVAVVDISQPTAPVLRSVIGSLADPVDVAIAGRIATIADRAEGLVVVDLADPANPSELGRAATSGAPESLALAGDLALVGVRQPGGSGALAVFDLASPSAPFLVAQLPLPTVAYAIAVNGDVVVASSWYALHVIDLTDPAAPVEIGRRDSTSVTGIALAGDIAYTSHIPGGLRLLDVSEPQGIFVTGAAQWEPFTIADGGPQGGYDIAVHDGAAVIADGRYGLRLVSVDRCLAGPAIPGTAVTADE